MNSLDATLHSIAVLAILIKDNKYYKSYLLLALDLLFVFLIYRYLDQINKASLIFSTLVMLLAHISFTAVKYQNTHKDEPKD